MKKTGLFAAVAALLLVFGFAGCDPATEDEMDKEAVADKNAQENAKELTVGTKYSFATSDYEIVYLARSQDKNDNWYALNSYLKFHVDAGYTYYIQWSNSRVNSDIVTNADRDVVYGFYYVYPEGESTVNAILTGKKDAVQPFKAETSGDYIIAMKIGEEVWRGSGYVGIRVYRDDITGADTPELTVNMNNVDRPSDSPADYDLIYLESQDLYVWYKFKVTEGKNYYVQWADRYCNSKIIEDVGKVDKDGIYFVYPVGGSVEKFTLRGDNEKEAQSFKPKADGVYMVALRLGRNDYNPGYVAIRIYTEEENSAAATPDDTAESATENK